MIHNYMDDIQKIEPKNEEQVMAMLIEYRENPTNALRNKLVEQNLKLAFKVASMYRRSGIPFADLVAEGNLGIIRGIEKFDLEKGVKLGYYLFRWIRAMILRYIVRNAHLVKMGTTQAQRKLFFNLSKTKAKARAQGHDISDQEIADLLEVKVEEVREMSQRLSAPVIRIEASEPDSKAHSGSAIHRLLQDRIDNNDDTELPDSILEREELSQRVRYVVSGFVSKLNDTQRSVFEARFLTIDGEPDTFEVIGQANGLTKQRIQQIDAELKKKFKKHLSHNQITLQS